MNRLKEGTVISAYIKNTRKKWVGTIIDDDNGCKKVVREDYRWTPLSNLVHIHILSESEDTAYEPEAVEDDIEEQLNEMTVGQVRKLLKEADKDMLITDASSFAKATFDKSGIDPKKVLEKPDLTKQAASALSSSAKGVDELKDDDISEEGMSNAIKDVALQKELDSNKDLQENEKTMNELAKKAPMELAESIDNVLYKFYIRG